MPKYRAIVEGQNFLIVHEDESQRLDFHRTLCLEADCIHSAKEKALEHVLAELSAQRLLNEAFDSQPNITLGHIEQVDVLEQHCSEQEFIWYFPDDAVFAHKLK